MNDKRFRKMAAIAEETRGWFRTLGSPGAGKGIVAWGSSYGLMREWVRHHPEYRVFLPEILHPFPIDAFEAWRGRLRDGAVVELSYQGQLHQILSSLTDLRPFRRVARSGGLPLSLPELVRMLEEPC